MCVRQRSMGDARTSGAGRGVTAQRPKAAGGTCSSPPRNGGGTVGALLEWWLATYSMRLASHASNVGSAPRHTAFEPGRAPPRCLTSAQLEVYLDAKDTDGLRPQTVNHLRSFLSRAFAAAIRVGRWTPRRVNIQPSTSSPTLRQSLDPPSRLFDPDDRFSPSPTPHVSTELGGVLTAARRTGWARVQQARRLITAARNRPASRR